MSLSKIFYSLSAGQPYFPETLFGVQSHPLRYLHMTQTVHLLAERFPERELNILEIGTWIGASALTWIYALDLYAKGQGTIYCCDLWETYFDIEAERRKQPDRGPQADVPALAMDTAAEAGLPLDLFLYNVEVGGGKGRIVTIKGDSRTSLRPLADGFFDLVYIDGDHRYRAVKSDIEEAKRLVRVGGIVAGDDLELQLHEVDEGVARSRGDADWVDDPKTGKGHHPGVTVAVAEAFGAIHGYNGYWLVEKQTDGRFLPVSLARRPIRMPPHVLQRARALTAGQPAPEGDSTAAPR
jgi:predicted O-methyltransferase YrrM